MDEIEWKKYIKKVLINFAKIFICTGIILFVLLVIMGVKIMGLSIITDIERIRNIILTICIIVSLGFILLEGIVALAMYIIYKIKYSGRKEIILEKEYLRELPKQYSPALVSLIYDLKIDIYKDYTATILYLCTKKYINIKHSEDKYEFEILNTDSSDLSESESYVLNKIINKTKFDEFEFSNLIIEEAKENFLITNRENNKIKNIIFTLLLVITLVIILFSKNMALFVFAIFLLIYMIYFYKKMKLTIRNSFNNIEKSDYTKYKRTRKGKKLAKELQAFKNFINEYTLINEKDINYVKILDEYIPYSISLGEANTIEKFIKHNEEYRNLIYDKKMGDM